MACEHNEGFGGPGTEQTPQSGQRHCPLFWCHTYTAEERIISHAFVSGDTLRYIQLESASIMTSSPMSSIEPLQHREPVHALTEHPAA